MIANRAGSPRPATAAEAYAMAHSPRPDASAKKAVGRGNGSGSSSDKQFKVDSDVKTMVVSGHTVWLAHNDGSIVVRKARTAELAHHFAAGVGKVWTMLALTVGGQDFVWVGLSNGDIEVYNANSKAFVQRLQRHTGGVYCLSEFNGQVFSGSNDFQIIHWDAAKMCFVRQLTGHSNYVRALYAEGSVVFSGSDDHTIRVWNATSGKHLNTAKFHSTGISALCRIGMHMWSGDDSGKIAVWRLQTLEHEETMCEHLGRVTAIKKVGSRVYTGSSDHDIIVWDAHTREQVIRINDHKGWVMALACPAQLARYYVWSAGADGSVRCWHHDEYRVMNPDMERFDDARWYNAEFTPYKELNLLLSDQINSLEGRCDHLQREQVSSTAFVQEQGEELLMAREQVKRWGEEVEGARLNVAENERSMLQLRAVAAQKERELQELSIKLRSYQNENVDLRVNNERLRVENEELRRRHDLAEKERVKLDTALKETLTSRAGVTGIVPLIVATETQAQDAMIGMQKQLADAIQMNHALIGDMNRYKAILGIPPTPVPKPIVVGSLAPPGVPGPSNAEMLAATKAGASPTNQRFVQQQLQQSQPGAPAGATAAAAVVPAATVAPTGQQALAQQAVTPGVAPLQQQPVSASGSPIAPLVAPPQQAGAPAPIPQPPNAIPGQQPAPVNQDLSSVASGLIHQNQQPQYAGHTPLTTVNATPGTGTMDSGVPAIGEGYHDRGAKWVVTNIKSYVHDRYFNPKKAPHEYSPRKGATPSPRKGPQAPRIPSRPATSRPARRN